MSDELVEPNEDSCSSSAEEQGEAELALALQHIAIDETGEDGDPEEEDRGRQGTVLRSPLPVAK